MQVHLRNGHAPGHVRDAFNEAVEAFYPWDGSPQPTVDFEVDYEPKPITLSQACNLVWQCTGVMPGWMFLRGTAQERHVCSWRTSDGESAGKSPARAHSRGEGRAWCCLPFFPPEVD